MTVIFDNDELRLSTAEYEAIQNKFDTWDDTFTTKGMSAESITAVIVFIEGLARTSPNADTLTGLVAQLRKELLPTNMSSTAVAPATTDDTVTAPDPADPPPPPDAPPVVVRTAPAAINGADFYDLPSEHKKVVAVGGRKLPLRNKNLVNLAVTAYYGVNREDIADDIKQKYQAATTVAYTEQASAVEARSRTRPGYKDADAFMVSGGGAYPPHWPAVPADDIPVHRPSVDVFTEYGEPGHAFTGIVRFGDRSDAGAPTDPKIILFPTQSEGEYAEQGVRKHPDDSQAPPEILENTRVYQAKSDKYTTHSGQGAQSSHGKLSDLVEKKAAYAELRGEGMSYQESGLTIGFTVIKGGASTANKFSFVSRSSNNPVFSLVSPAERQRFSGNAAVLGKLQADREEQYRHLSIEGDGSVTAEWGQKIIQSVESALAVRALFD